jgi:hypothetical protein
MRRKPPRLRHVKPGLVTHRHDDKTYSAMLALLRCVHSEIGDLDPSGDDDSVTQAMCIVFRHIENIESSFGRS